MPPETHKPSDLEIKRAFAVAADTLTADAAGKMVEAIRGIDAVNISNVMIHSIGELTQELEAAKKRIAQLEPLAKRPTQSGPTQPLPVNRRAPAANEVLPPEQRASWARERTEHDADLHERAVRNGMPPSGRKA